MIYYDSEARRLFASERAQLLQNEMRTVRRASTLNPGEVLRRPLALLARALRMRRKQPDETPRRAPTAA